MINLQDEENALLKSFSKFEIYFKHSLINNEPHHLADYLYELSSLFNSMYQKENILSEEEFQRFSVLKDQELETHFQHLKIETLEEQNL